MVDARTKGALCTRLNICGCWVNNFCHITITPYDLYFRNMTSISWCFTGSLECSKPWRMIERGCTILKYIGDHPRTGIPVLSQSGWSRTFSMRLPQGQHERLGPRPQLTAGRLKRPRATLMLSWSTLGQLLRENSAENFPGDSLGQHFNGLEKHPS